MSSFSEFPIKHIEDNLIFSREDEVWAYFKLDGFNYSFLSDEDKIRPFGNHASFLVNNDYDIHYISDPTATNIASILDQTIEEMKTLDYGLQENGIAYMQELKEVLTKHNTMSETSEYVDYIGIQLNPHKNKYQSANAGNNIIRAIKHFIEGLNSPVYTAVGLEPYDIPLEVIEAYKTQADSLKTMLTAAFDSQVHSISSAELVYLVEKKFSVSVNYMDVELRDNFDSGYDVDGVDNNGNEHKAIRPKQKAFIDLQNTSVEEVGPKTLLLKKIIDNEVEELYTQHLICHDMDDQRFHPGSEWLHNLKSNLGFPISVSIRAYHQPTEFIQKKLSNKRLEYKDQRTEARKGGEDVDLDVQDSERGTIQMEKYFKDTAQPAYNCSYVIKVSAKEKKTLNVRVERIINQLSRYGISVVAPFGEQMNLVMESIPGSKRYNN